MPLNPRGLYRLKIMGELHGQACETAFHFMTRDSSTHTTYASEMQAILTDFLLTPLTKFLLCCSQQYTAKSIMFVSLIPSPGVLIEHKLTNAIGAQTDDSLPSFCAGLLVFRSGVSGRSGHGRIYIPGVSENLSSDSRLEGSYFGLVQDFGSYLVTRYGASGSFGSARGGTFSRKLGVTRLAGPPPRLSYSIAGFFTYSSAIARPEIATMRKRKLGRGQ